MKKFSKILMSIVMVFAGMLNGAYSLSTVAAQSDTDVESGAIRNNHKYINKKITYL